MDMGLKTLETNTGIYLLCVAAPTERPLSAKSGHSTTELRGTPTDVS